MCGLRWKNGMHFGTRKSKCEVCEEKYAANIKRLAPAVAKRAAQRDAIANAMKALRDNSREDE